MDYSNKLSSTNISQASSFASCNGDGKINKQKKVLKRTKTNFIKENIMKVDNLIPDTGPSRNVASSGKRYHNCNLLIPTFSLSKGYGKVPTYINKIKRVLADEKKTKEELKPKQTRDVGLTCITPHERFKILQRLKTDWAGVNKQYLLLPLIVDTPSQIKRKEMLESEMTALEKEMCLIQYRKNIFTCFDSNRMSFQHKKKRNNKKVTNEQHSCPKA